MKSTKKCTFKCFINFGLAKFDDAHFVGWVEIVATFLGCKIVVYLTVVN